MGSCGLGPLLCPRACLGPEDGGLLTLHHSEPELHADPGALSMDCVSLIVNKPHPSPRWLFPGKLGLLALRTRKGESQTLGLVRGGLGLGHPRS